MHGHYYFINKARKCSSGVSVFEGFFVVVDRIIDYFAGGVFVLEIINGYFFIFQCLILFKKIP
jgi:uncharacterized protein (DUF433 family)